MKSEDFISIEEVMEEVAESENAGYAMFTAVVYTAPILKRQR